MQKIRFTSSIILILVLASLFTFLANHNATASTVTTYVINASRDDAWSKDNDIKWDTDECYLSTADTITGCRWRIDIPKGATILNANFICKAKNQKNMPNTIARIETFDQDSCDDFDTIFWNWQVMGEYVDWLLPELFLPNTWYTSPDLKTTIQAYINRTGYKAGNYFGLRIKYQSGEAAGHEIWTWDFNPDNAAKLEITYEPPEPPVADFQFSPENPTVNESITFDATSSYAPSSYIVTYSWNFGDSTPTVNETDPTILHTYTTSGFYNVTLLVTDDNGSTNSTTKEIKIRNLGVPLASFTYQPQQPIVNETLTFNASSSYDSDGMIIDFYWDFGDGVNASGIIAYHSYNSTGIYVVTLRVTDDDYLTDYKTESVSVSKYPTASFEYLPLNPVVGEVVTFNASASTPDGGFIVTYQWNFGDNTSKSEINPITTHTYSTHGNYNVTLNVTDSEGLWSVTSRSMIVSAPPVAFFAFSPSTPTANKSTTFNASLSYDPDGFIVNYTWNFGDGNITYTTASIINHTYLLLGNCNVTLTVTDNDGYTNSILNVVTINMHDIAVLNVTISDTEVHIGQVINITVTVKNKGTVTESFDVTVLRNGTSISTILVTNLAATAEKTLIFQWNTSNIAYAADFLIRAEADIVSGEDDVANNVYADGTIRVSQIPADGVSSLQDWNWLLFLLIPLAILLFVGGGITWKKKHAHQKLRGFDFFDEITDGGIPSSFSVLVTGEPGSGKSIFCQQLTHKFLVEGKPCVYVTYDCFPNEVRENMGKFRWDLSNYEKEGKLVFVDCFSSIAQVTSKEKYSVNQPFSLSDLGIMLSKATSEKANVLTVFFDSIVPLLTHVDQSRVVEFLQDRSARVKGANGTFIFTVGKETIQPNLLSRLEELADCVIELDTGMSQGKTIKRLRIKKMRGRKASDKWILFDINSANGIVFLV